MNVLVNLTPAQWDWVLAASLELGVDPSRIVFRLLELGHPALDREIRNRSLARPLKPRRRLRLVK